MSQSIVNDFERVEKLVQKYNDVLNDLPYNLAKEYHIVEYTQLQETLETITSEGKKLNIGIVGRVKAGKSSLLNSVFFDGRNVLPKAATPMTASLTVLEWGEKCSAVVEYFTPEDITKIKTKYDEYCNLFEKYKAEEIKNLKKPKSTGNDLNQEDLEKIERKAKKRINNEVLKSSFEQYSLMEKSGKLSEFKTGKTSDTLEAIHQEELINKLNDYVGSKGILMPFTKSVRIRLPEEKLKDIEIVDTPGLNDPVVSRSQRTEEFLGKCDVVFVVSPAGQFMSIDDLNLMDRLSAKEGVSEIFLVASRSDQQFYGSEGENANWDLNKTLQSIQENLGSQARNVFMDLIKEFPETKKQFGQLLDNNLNKVIITSSICHALAINYDNQKEWDETMSHNYNLLKEKFPDYFDTKEATLCSLEKIHGIQNVIDKINYVREQKDIIIAKKCEDYLASQEASFNSYLKELIKNISNKITEIRTTDINAINEQYHSLEKARILGSGAVDQSFDDCLDDFLFELKQSIRDERSKIFNDAKENISNEEKTITKTETWETGWWLWKKKHFRDYEIQIIKVGAVKGQLIYIINNLIERLIMRFEEAKINWKSKLQHELVQAIMENIGSDSIKINKLKAAVRDQVNNLPDPYLDLNDMDPSTYFASVSGTLEGYDCEEFLSNVTEYMNMLRSNFDQRTTVFLNEIKNILQNEKMSTLLFDDIKKQLDELQQAISNKELVINRLSTLQNELEKN